MDGMSRWSQHSALQSTETVFASVLSGGNFSEKKGVQSKKHTPFSKSSKQLRSNDQSLTPSSPSWYKRFFFFLVHLPPGQRSVQLLLFLGQLSSKFIDLGLQLCNLVSQFGGVAFEFATILLQLLTTLLLFFETFWKRAAREKWETTHWPKNKNRPPSIFCPKFPLCLGLLNKINRKPWPKMKY